MLPNARYGTMTDKDWQELKLRDPVRMQREDPQAWAQFKDQATYLFATNKHADRLNIDRMFALGNKVATIQAINSKGAQNFNASDAGGVHNTTLLSVGTKVMLSTNLNTDFGLANGTIGLVTEIIYSPEADPTKDIPKAVLVEFDGYSGPAFQRNGADVLGPNGGKVVAIGPYSADWSGGKGQQTKQFKRTGIPLSPCWAITIHKSQVQLFFTDGYRH